MMSMCTALTEEKIYCLTSTGQCSFSSSYKPGDREIDSFSTRGEPGRRQSAKTACHSAVLFTFGHIQRPEGTDEAEREGGRDRYGATISAIKTNWVWWWWMYIPPVIFHQAKVRRCRACM